MDRFCFVGISGEVIRIDAGHCRKLCPRHVSDDPGDASRPAVQKCSSDFHCRARAAKLERVSTLQGVRVIEAIDACDCSPETSCRRESYIHYVHSGTPHQAVVDIGVCIGHCAKDLGCKPVRNNTISAKGPNGDEIYQVVEKCGCAGHCYRMDHMETVLDYSEVTIKEGTNTTDVRPVTRQINVGQCVGTCPGNETETCLLRDKKEPSRCLAGLYSKQHTCTPARFKVHEYRRGSTMVMTRRASCCFLVLLLSLTSLCDVNAYPKLDLQTEDRDGLEQELRELLPFIQSADENELAPQREKALQKIQEILGIRSQNENLAHRKVPPQFMMELYNTIADPSGVTRGQNPHNARIVRSFVERDPFLSNFYFFNVSGLEMNESVLEAELHLYRKKIPSRNIHPLTSASPYYLIRVYQVLDDRSLDVPDLHRLLSVRYVGAHASGWQIFNVKQAVLDWMSGEPNLGLLVTTQDLFEDEVLMEFSRRNDYHHSKQPILVLFDDDSSDRSSERSVTAPRYYAYGKQEDNEENHEKGPVYEKNAENEKIDLENDYDGIEHYTRHKRQQEGDVSRYGNPLETTRRRRRDSTFSRKRTSCGIVSRNCSRTTRILTSMDIYERAMFRERLGQVVKNRSTSVTERRRRPARSASSQSLLAPERPGNATECTRHELYVDFHDIGLSSSIIAPAGYSAYQCKGVCEPPLSQNQRPTNHATIQAIVHKMAKGVERPCCVPTKLLSTSILFYDDNENVVLKMYEDMIADHCGCR
ncbi:Protein DVR-1 [Trachymyrmex cornetzi]|uniref:Protein DVR-1 n=1 Tax=Trachymyrmex cornetzi TaxID=471704 RepID=A0A151IU28_9HYME|nr:Protein DVR-1 [Trachymyrmex cornetzi]